MLQPKSLELLRDYSLPRFWGDVGSGITVGIVALPLAMAFAIASGARPEQGLYTAIVAGAMSYRKLGREEDPAFAIKTMVVQATWPGATISDTLDQVTDRIEKELQQISAVDYTRSYTTPGQATVFVNLRDTTPPQTIPWLFYQVRKRLGDIKGTFPQGMQGPFFNDEFGDVYGNVYAFTADGL